MDQGYCMKCGREIRAEQVFCDQCLAEMEKYPVKPGVVVLLPRREEQPAKASVRRRHPVTPPEEQLKKLKKWMVGVCIALMLSLTANAFLGWLVILDQLEEQKEAILPGQNYSSENSSEPSENH